MPTVRKRGDKYQSIVRIARNGVMVHQESRMFSTRKLALDWGRRVEQEVQDKGASAVKLRRTTLGAFLLQYAEGTVRISPERAKLASELARLGREFISTPLDAPSNTFVEFAGRRREGGASPATVKTELAHIRAALNAGQAALGIPTSAAAVAEAMGYLQRGKVIASSVERERRVSDDEIEQLREGFIGINDHPSTILPMELIVPLAVALPRRAGELVRMRWDDYDATRGTVRLRDTKAKARIRDEVIAVPANARALIAKLPRTDERILPYKAPSISTSFTRMVHKLALPDLHFHDLRHEGITRLFEQGLSIPEVANISGHLSWQQLKRYTHLDAATLADKLAQ